MTLQVQSTHSHWLNSQELAKSPGQTGWKAGLDPVFTVGLLAALSLAAKIHRESFYCVKTMATCAVAGQVFQFPAFQFPGPTHCLLTSVLPCLQ